MILKIVKRGEITIQKIMIKSKNIKLIIGTNQTINGKMEERKTLPFINF